MPNDADAYLDVPNVGVYLNRRTHWPQMDVGPFPSHPVSIRTRKGPHCFRLQSDWQVDSLSKKIQEGSRRSPCLFPLRHKLNSCLPGPGRPCGGPPFQQAPLFAVDVFSHPTDLGPTGSRQERQKWITEVAAPWTMGWDGPSVSAAWPTGVDDRLGVRRLGERWCAFFMALLALLCRSGVCFLSPLKGWMQDMSVAEICSLYTTREKTR